jgi:tetratricopeptide (TPR) repeat protein
MARWRSGGTVLAFALAFAVPAGAQTGSAESSADHLRQGEEAYARGDLNGAKGHFEEAANLTPRNFTALQWLSRAEADLGENAKGEEQRRLFSLAVEHARAAVAVAPDSGTGHLSLAVALGRQALHEGPKTRLALSKEVKAEADRAIALDSTLDRAYHVRALWNRKIASLSFIERTAANTVLGGVPKGASMENCVADLEKAIALDPNYVNHHLELGRTFFQLKRDDEGRRELERAIALPPTSSPRDSIYQAEARELLRRKSK